jgi:hypothetical protein
MRARSEEQSTHARLGRAEGNLAISTRPDALRECSDDERRPTNRDRPLRADCAFSL